MRWTIQLLILFLVLLPIASAFDCSLTSNPNQCNQIINSNINESQKDNLLSFLLYNSTSFPDHNFILDYNSKIKVNSSIGNTTNSIYIKNAWLSLITIMPSILENNTLYVPDNTFVLSDYGYEILIPINYQASKYPEKQNGDCKTIYKLTSNSSNLNVLVNNQDQGSLKLNPVQINQDSLIKDKLDIKTTIQQDNYQWKQYCIKFRKSECIKYEYKCEYKSTINLQDSLVLTDSINVRHYGNKPNANIQALDNYYNTTKLQYLANDYTTLNIDFKNSSYKEQKYTYSIEFIKKPFYISMLKANKVNIKQANNILTGLNNTLFVKNINDCKISASNFFYKFTQSCNLILKQEVKETIEVVPFEYNLMNFFKLFIFVFMIYLIYRVIKHFAVNAISPF
jgi:hypothetical protein